MRDSSSIPNVFRATSALSINGKDHQAPVIGSDVTMNKNVSLKSGQPKLQQLLQEDFGYQQHQSVAHDNNRYQPSDTIPRFVSSPATTEGTKRERQQLNLKKDNSSAVAGLINTVSGSIPSTGISNSGMMRGCEAEGAPRVNIDNSSHLNRTQKQLFQMHPGHGNIKGSSARLERNKGGCLWILTPVAASISVAIVIAALAGPQWLFTEEKLPNVNYNGTANFNVLDDGAFITKYTKSSLWILCSSLQGIGTYNCIKIDYFPKEGYQPDPHDSTPAIPYTVTKSCPFFLAAGFFLVISFIVFLIPTCSHQNSLYYFSAGIMFIVSGLLMLIGLIAYISILKAEIGSKLRSRSTLQPALFKITYGQSFFLFVFGFIATELVGLLSIFLYISLQEVGYYSRLPCFTMANLKERIKEGASSHNSYKSYKYKPSIDLTMPPVPKHGNNNHQVHSSQTSVQKIELRLDGPKLLQHMPGYACRKHPDRLGSNFVCRDDLERRYYLEKPPSITKCNLHSKNLAKSLNELYTEPALPMGPPPPPSTIRMGQACTLPRQQQSAQFRELPQEFPLTRSVSTTTDIYSNDTHGTGDIKSKPTPYLEHRNRRNMATNTRLSCMEMDEINENAKTNITRGQKLKDISDMEEPRLCGLKRGIRKTKDEFFQEFCKRAGVRPKPKNIYYITNENEKSDNKFCRRRTANFSRSTPGAANGNRDEVMKAINCQKDEDDVRDNQLLLQEDEEHIYIIDDFPYLLTSPAKNIRRASMYAEPTHLRKRISDLSLQIPCPPEVLQRSLMDLESCDYNKNQFGGSQDHLRLEYVGAENESFTLPRSFAKRSTDSLNSMGSASLHASNHVLPSVYSVSRHRPINLMTQHQQQKEQYQQHVQEQKNRFIPLSRGIGPYRSASDLNNTCENSTSNYQTSVASSVFTHASRLQHQNLTAMQWPAVIPSSPLNLPSKYQKYGSASNTHVTPHLVRAPVARSASGDGGSCNHGSALIGPSKFQRGYAFDDQRRLSPVITDTFDLDEIERERRRSHASLFSEAFLGAFNDDKNYIDRYDLINGTAV